MKLYNDAPPDLLARMQAIIERSHERLTQHKVTIGVVMVVEDSDEPMPCLRHQGYDAIAIVSKTPVKHRAKGAPDALVEIDQVRWDELGELEQDAVLDHELTHLEPQCKDSGELKRDGCGRPILKIRLHDHQFGWFDEVAARHKAASQEVQQYVRLVENVHQQWFAFAQDRKSGGSKNPVGQARKPARKGKRGATSFEREVDELMDDLKRQGVKVRKNVSIKVGGRRAAQR